MYVWFYFILLSSYSFHLTVRFHPSPVPIPCSLTKIIIEIRKFAHLNVHIFAEQTLKIHRTFVKTFHLSYTKLLNRTDDTEELEKRKGRT